MTVSKFPRIVGSVTMRYSVARFNKRRVYGSLARRVNRSRARSRRFKGTIAAASMRRWYKDKYKPRKYKKMAIGASKRLNRGY